MSQNSLASLSFKKAIFESLSFLEIQLLLYGPNVIHIIAENSWDSTPRVTVPLLRILENIYCAGQILSPQICTSKFH